MCVLICNGIDDNLFTNLDWDPLYLASIFDEDFNDMSDLWKHENISDTELLNAMDGVGKYCPVVEDISIDDNDLYDAVEQIEQE